MIRRTVIPGTLLPPQQQGPSALPGAVPTRHATYVPHHVPLDRASANDMMQRAVEAGSVPMQVGACLVLAPGPDADTIRDTLAARVPGVGRLRQRLVTTPPGCGRPIWVDDARFDISNHLHTDACPTPGDEQALLTRATEILGVHLPRERPLWSATILTGMTGGRTGLIIVFDHVLADGIGGLAVLANLVDGPLAPDGAATPVDVEFPRPAPPTWVVARDAVSARWTAIRSWRRGLRQLRAGIAELRAGGNPVAAKTSLNRPTGTHRATRAVRVDLETVRARAHTRGATVNDAVLAGVTGALAALLRRRGEQVDHLVVSMPVSTRQPSSADHLGNEVGVAPVDLPTIGSFDDRMAQIATITRAAKTADRARVATASLVAPIFRLLGALHLIRPFMDHQRMINTIATNVRGPAERLSFAGATIERVIPMSIVTGNVAVGFAVLSYAGTLTITINADADVVPDLDDLAALLTAELPAPAASRS